MRLSRSRSGRLVWAAFDGPSAVETARAHVPDVIVLDLMLPGFDGVTAREFALLAALAEQPGRVSRAASCSSRRGAAVITTST